MKRLIKPLGAVVLGGLCAQAAWIFLSIPFIVSYAPEFDGPVDWVYSLKNYSVFLICLMAVICVTQLAGGIEQGGEAPSQKERVKFVAGVAGVYLLAYSLGPTLGYFPFVLYQGSDGYIGNRIIYHTVIVCAVMETCTLYLKTGGRLFGETIDRAEESAAEPPSEQK